MAKNNVLLSSVEGMSLIQAIRSNHSHYSEHQHNDILIGILNSFARVDCDLPAGWEKRTDPKTKKVSAWVIMRCVSSFTFTSALAMFLTFVCCLHTEQKVFVDHNNHLTTYIDPRLPYVGNEGLVRSQDPLPPAPIPVCEHCVLMQVKNLNHLCTCNNIDVEHIGLCM